MSSTDAQQPAAKRARSTPLIATHSGTFHCDESLAVFLLRLLPAYRDSSLVRTRDSKLLADADIVVDVGGEYEPSKHRYDHHQKGFTEVFGGKYDKTKLSSAGLVYKCVYLAPNSYVAHGLTRGRCQALWQGHLCRAVQARPELTRGR